MSIIFTQASIFHLYRLGLVVMGKTGEKYRLSDEGDMNALIRYCDQTRDPSISRQFDAFLDSVDPATLALMKAKRLISYGSEARSDNRGRLRSVG
ncbi:hypothetical protein NO559_14210 [Dasania sp. GY-MA-18]|uniref:Uncharacterized protein n=1 Tax=Dasania phycosphaerae TaxID=2950436 RepID=A0A9J6RQG1_9GAMM|nr:MULTISPECIES: hypothetical protein [Dasania]MCR8923933.1 hypothetical protein [Dasania sp. GY-MA-18]MCZ0866367.1 hypothetical protein [Dasania phycosphaerae]MCZ0870091.1 hypothetical protein [Dasania phycosphaerae]